MTNHPQYQNAPNRDESFSRADRFRTRNYALCTAINVTSLGVVTDMMIERGADPKEIKHLKDIADSTLQLLRKINERLEK